MIFTDLQFFPFFAAAFLVYWAIGSNDWRKLWLLLCSAVFYSAWDWRFLALVALVIVNTYVVTLAVGTPRLLARRRAILAAGIAVSLVVLGFFKYYNFFAASLAPLLHLDLRIAAIVLPIGISFYTFHSISYMVDTFRGKIVPRRNLVDVALYILFFPQLVAGPIVRATDLLPQMSERRSFADVPVKYFLTLFLIGYVKKAVVSDNFSTIVDAFFADPAKFGAGDAALAAFCYSVQIYCDFSGYTDMAIAIAGLLGYRLKPNFDYPYLAANIIEFWRRWHMSLSSWLRDYLYVPLGGNRAGEYMRARNVMITMLLGGLWHGASWTFVAWGGLHGVALLVCHAWQRARGTTSAGGFSMAASLVTFAFVTFAWIFFRAPTFEIAAQVLARFTIAAGPTLLSPPEILVLVPLLVMAHTLSCRLKLDKMAAGCNDLIFAAAYGGAVALILPFVNVAVQPFIYFQF